ncbi:MAG: hypothetical protein RIR45_2146 [Pseudomonadota bacterium]
MIFQQYRDTCCFWSDLHPFNGLQFPKKVRNIQFQLFMSTLLNGGIPWTLGMRSQNIFPPKGLTKESILRNTRPMPKFQSYFTGT